MPRQATSFRIGRVRGYLRGRVWYLYYHENGRRRRPRVGPDHEAARQLAAQVNGQLEAGAPASLSLEPVTIADLQQRWLEHHEHVLRSSVAIIDRYRTATAHLLRFLERRPVRYASQFQATHAEEFVRFLRTVRVSSNGHPNTRKRALMDKGLRYVLECCRSLFNYAARRRHLPPYAENPFHTLGVDRIPGEECRAIVLFTADQERAFLQACDRWQFPLFLTLLLTGLRPGELTHLLLPDDLDLEGGLLRVRNKPRLGWRVKTRNEREIPLEPMLSKILRWMVGPRATGPVFYRRRFAAAENAPLAGMTMFQLEQELSMRLSTREQELGRPPTRAEQRGEARGVWRDLGAVEEGRVRAEFMRLTAAIGLPHATAPKALRHQFATCLQDANVDPLVRMELLGHSPGGSRNAGGGLGMTATYTHTRPETRRRQLLDALVARPAASVAESWLDCNVLNAWRHH